MAIADKGPRVTIEKSAHETGIMTGNMNTLVKYKYYYQIWLIYNFEVKKMIESIDMM